MKDPGKRDLKGFALTLIELKFPFFNPIFTHIDHDFLDHFLFFFTLLTNIANIRKIGRRDSKTSGLLMNTVRKWMSIHRCP